MRYGIEDDVLKLTKEALNISDIPDRNFYIYDGLKAFEHMCEFVAAGLQGRLQETFGQFKNAYNSAKAFRMLCYYDYVEKFLKYKKSKTETKIGINPLSVSGLSFNLVKERLENPETRKSL